jgi:hypothetical protein
MAIKVSQPGVSTGSAGCVPEARHQGTMNLQQAVIFRRYRVDASLISLDQPALHRLQIRHSIGGVRRAPRAVLGCRNLLGNFRPVGFDRPGFVLSLLLRGKGCVNIFICHVAFSFQMGDRRTQGDQYSRGLNGPRRNFGPVARKARDGRFRAVEQHRNLGQGQVDTAVEQYLLQPQQFRPPIKPIAVRPHVRWPQRPVCVLMVQSSHRYA